MKKVMLAEIFIVSIVMMGEARCNADSQCEACEGTIDGFFCGGGIGYEFSENEASSNKAKESQKNNRPFGTVVIGAGKGMHAHPVYFGGEISVDLSSTKHASVKLNGTEIKMRGNGVAPSFCFRVGYLSPATNFMMFIKAGGAQKKSTMEYSINSCPYKITNAKLTPIVALGVEAALKRKIGVRAEIEYEMENSKSNDEHKLKSGPGLKLKLIFTYKLL
ncbi:MAG: hypothetical protein LBS23_01630 [Holosporaceae bacterium]|jgi:hypothetical protein|nr:hypothetical protein [Holosporaceae bacterium]